MTTVLLSSLGSPGDINPFIAIGAALKRRGVRPLFLANPYDIPAIEAHDIETIPVGESWDLMSLVASDPKYLLSAQAGIHTTREIFIPFSERLFPVARAAVERHRPAASISHAFCFGASWAAKAAGMLNIVAHLAPISLLSGDVFTIYPAFRRILFSLVMPMGKAQFNQLVQPLCGRLGVPWHKHIIEETMGHPDLLLGMWSKEFADLSSMAGRTDRVTCGFPVTPGSGTGAGSEIESFLRKGDPPVAVTLGTNAFAFAGNFFEHALQAADRLGLRVVFISRTPPKLELPTSACAVGFADYRHLFPRCRAVVHHGGIGVTAAALRAGVPAVVVPFGHDQEDNGMRVEALGAGRVVSRAKTGRRLMGALAQALSKDTSATAKRLGETIGREPDGAEVAAEGVQRRLLTGQREASAG